jgi:hypothetical protein
MSAPKDGGSAFPTMKPAYQLQSGMTLRDWFAGMALQGVCGSPEMLASYSERGGEKSIAKGCYKMADAMLAAREGKEESK